MCTSFLYLGDSLWMFLERLPPTIRGWKQPIITFPDDLTVIEKTHDVDSGCHMHPTGTLNLKLVLQRSKARGEIFLTVATLAALFIFSEAKAQSVFQISDAGHSPCLCSAGVPAPSWPVQLWLLHGDWLVPPHFCHFPILVFQPSLKFSKMPNSILINLFSV